MEPEAALGVLELVPWFKLASEEVQVALQKLPFISERKTALYPHLRRCLRIFQRTVSFVAGELAGAFLQAHPVLEEAALQSERHAVQSPCPLRQSRYHRQRNPAKVLLAHCLAHLKLEEEALQLVSSQA